MIIQDIVTVVTDGDGAATAYSNRMFNGFLVGISYIKTDYPNGVDFTIISENSEQTLWDEDDVNASAMKYPMAPVSTSAGVAATYDGTYPVLRPIPLFNERIQIGIVAGGDTKTGTFGILVESDYK